MLTPLITCEHAGKTVPDLYGRLFTAATEVLDTHRGWDPGALEIASFLADKLGAPLFKCDATRLLVEPNRSLFSINLFSEYSSGLTQEEREEVLRQYYYPHRSGVESWINNSRKPVLHLSIHSFTPVFNGVTRLVDVGLLFDPVRKGEAEFCSRYQHHLRALLPNFLIEFNEPYKGIDDGFTTHLRMNFADADYYGIEIEVNQKYIGSSAFNEIKSALLEGAHAIINR